MLLQSRHLEQLEHVVENHSEKESDFLAFFALLHYKQDTDSILIFMRHLTKFTRILR